jgi:hypothetical protein
VLYGLFFLSLLRKGTRQLLMDLSGARLHLQRLTKVFDGTVEISLASKELAEVIVCLRISRVDSQSIAKLRNGCAWAGCFLTLVLFLAGFTVSALSNLVARQILAKDI